MSEVERQVRERAYLLWEQAGQPAGRSEEFWFAALREVAGESAAAAPAGAQDFPAEEPPELAAQHGVPVGLPGERIAEQGVLDDELAALVLPAAPHPVD